jgi:hypothetical protein
MYNFIVLGIVPGTNLQITFETWLVMLEVALVIIGLERLLGLRRWLNGRLAVEAVLARSPLPANQLHRRG